MRNTVGFGRRVVLLAGLLGLASPVCRATDYYIWKGAATDSVTTYSKYNVANSSGTDTGTSATGEIPSGSIVFIPNGRTYPVDDGTADFCGALGGLRLQGKDAVIELALENNHTFGCYIYGTGSTWAQVVKSGAGTLTLTADGTDLVASNRRMHYCAYWRVAGGEVVFWPLAAGATYNVQSIWVDAGATVRLPPGKALFYVPGFISGGGTIAHATDGETGVLLISASHPTSLFTGTITGKVRLELYGLVNLKTASNEFTGGVRSYNGVLGFTDLGSNNAETSSVGKMGDITIYSGLTLTNLIDETVGEKTSSRGFRHYGADPGDTYTLTFDGGDYGKFNYTGSLQVYCNKVLSCILRGEHSNPCTFSPSVVNMNGTTGWYMLTKRGTGTWKMSGSKSYSANFGGLMIENGILQMARIKAIKASDGGYTSCGWLTNETRYCGYAYKGTVANAPSPVNYAIRLGKADDLSQCGILEYVGSDNVSCLNRAFALTGKGGFKNETAKNFIIGPIASEPLPEGGDAPALNTLVLESSNSSVNETCNVTENAGAIRIEKRGTGTWILNQNQTFTGGVDIQGGALVISNQANYAVLPSGLDYVKTCSGTTLKTIGNAVAINSLTIDATQGLGDIDNCAFASAGTIYLTNYTEKASQTFAADLSAAVGLANLAGWTVSVNGTESDKYRIMADATGLRIDYVSPGFVILFH